VLAPPKISQATQTDSYSDLGNVKTTTSKFAIPHSFGDQRPYLHVRVFGITLLGLLDSGASHTIVGSLGFGKLNSLGLRLVKQSLSCTVANGQSCISEGYFSLPITLRSRTRLINVLYIPSFMHELILGVDFWKVMGVVPDLERDIWHFSSPLDQTVTCNLTN